MKRIIALSLFAVLLVSQAKAQDPEFTQFYANPLYLNPAFAGTAIGPRFCINYRNQWPGVSGTFVTYAASYDEHFDGIGGGIGGQIWKDRAGDGRLSTTNFSGMYSYHLQLQKNTRDFFIVKAAIQAGGFQRSIDFSKLRFGDQIHPRLGFIYQTKEKLPATGLFTTKIIPDFSTGILAFTSKFYAGIAVHHIVEPSQSFFDNPESVLPRKITVHGGMQIAVDNYKRNPNTFISPNILFQRQSKFTQVNFGAYLLKNYFIAGLWYRQTSPNSDAMMALVGFKKDAVRIGYSYDLTVSSARSAAPGRHEVSLIVELQKYKPSQKRKWKGLKCPTNFGN